MNKRPSKENFTALLVHLFTATGAVFAMLAMLAAADEKWSLMFLWLVVAFAVDGIDGPLARHFDVKKNAPRFDGNLLDLIIDYLTYVFIPAFALFKSGLLPGWTGWFAIIIITFSSALYFCDTNMKTKDNSFQGFPGCWNMVILVLFAIKTKFLAHNCNSCNLGIIHVFTNKIHTSNKNCKVAHSKFSNSIIMD